MEYGYIFGFETPSPFFARHTDVTNLQLLNALIDCLNIPHDQ